MLEIFHWQISNVSDFFRYQKRYFIKSSEFLIKRQDEMEPFGGHLVHIRFTALNPR